MRKYVLLWLILLIVFNCVTDQNPPLDPKNGNQIKEIVVLQPGGTDFFYQVDQTNTGSSSHLLLGKCKDEYSARILLQFNAFTDSAIVDSAKIVLYTQALLGDSSSSFDVSMYKIESPWDEKEVTYWTDPELSFDSSIVLSSANITSISSDSDSVAFILTPELVSNWMDSTSADTNGVWIKCDGATFIKDFYSGESSSSSKRPKLKIKYRKIGQEDTTRSTYSYPANDAFILLSNLNLDENFLYIGKGVPFRSYLKFDVESIIDSTATISRADLQLIVNQENSIFDASEANNLQLSRLTSESIEPETMTIDSALLYYYTPSVCKDTVTVNMRGLVQEWSSKNPDYTNYGLLLQSYSENLTLARSAFYSSIADSVYAPKLIITYTLPPDREDY